MNNPLNISLFNAMVDVLCHEYSLMIYIITIQGGRFKVIKTPGCIPVKQLFFYIKPFIRFLNTTFSGIILQIPHEKYYL